MDAIQKLRNVRTVISAQIAELNTIGQDVDCDDGINDAIAKLDEALQAVEGALTGTEDL